MKKNINLILIFLLLTSCGGFKLKKENVDEFSVKKEILLKRVVNL